MRAITAGSTDVQVNIKIIDAADGTPEEAVEHDSSGIALWYRRAGGLKVAITPAALAALDDAHADGGIEHIDDGIYRLDLPDAAVAVGAEHVTIGGTVTGMIVLGGEIPLVAYNPADAVRLGLTALPNAAADAAGGLPISDAGGLDADAILSGIAAIFTNTNTDIPALIAALDDLNSAQIQAACEAALNAAQAESYHANGDPASVINLLWAILQYLTDSAKIGAVITVSKQDGNAAYTLLLDNATNPTIITRND
ncbi:MAG: hypothetical protein AB7T38_02480 [Nitrospirales bacterium]